MISFERQHNLDGLKQMQSLPLDIKIQMTKLRIKAWYDHWDGDVYVSFSGGKDSTVLKHIVDSMYDDIPSVFINTGLEYPEVRQFALKQKNTIRIDPKMKFYEVIEKYGYPVVSKEQSQYIYECRTTKSEKLRNRRLYGDERKMGKISNKWMYLLDAPFKISNMCCNITKKYPVKKYEKETGRKAILGTLACESATRTVNWLKFGCNAFTNTRPTSQPLSFWTEQDILQYIYENKLEIPSVYGEVIKTEDGFETTGLHRTGCMFCLFGIQKEEQPNRFQIMQKTHPRQYEYCLNKLGIKNVLEFMKIPYKNDSLTIEMLDNPSTTNKNKNEINSVYRSIVPTVRDGQSVSGTLCKEVRS